MRLVIRRIRLQRLFSTFAEGWPGAGLLLQRILTSAIILYCGITHLLEVAIFAPRWPCLIACVGGVFLLLGLWTPVAGTTIAIVGVWVFFTCSAHSLTAMIVAVLGATVAMIGPGMWSIDAKLYGRKRLQDPRR
jgi:putative oxidoreductase